jgi:thioesterase domain-containing protein/acyl carrier protein
MLSRMTSTAAITKTVVKYCGARPFKVLALPKSLIEKSPLGKLARPKIRQAFEAGLFIPYEVEDHRSFQDPLASSDFAGTITQNIVLQIFRNQFGANAAYLGLASDLFDIGFSSIDLLKLKAHLRDALKIEIPVTIFFSYPVIHDLGQALDDLKKKAVYDPVTILQPNGSKMPLFFIHPGVGEVLIFMNIARYIDDRPVYALRARGFDGEEYFSSMEEMVTVYHQAIKRVQPTGPYAIAGYSFGSILAFEITKTMEANGDIVQFLATIDQPPHFKERAKTYDWYEVVLTISFFMGLIKEDDAYALLPDMRQKTHDEVINHILTMANPDRLAEVCMTRQRLNNWAKLAYQLKVIAWEYDPTGIVANMDVFYTGPLPIVKAKNMTEWFNDYISKWMDFATDIKFHEVKGTHRTMMSTPHASRFQKKLKTAMEERGV